jgi:hypothetical protein
VTDTKNTAAAESATTDALPGAVLRVPDIAPDTDNLTAALAWANARWYVLPVDRRDPKNPGSVVGKHWQRQSSRDPKTITAWFAGTSHGIALHCGRSGAVVLDIDHPDKLPDVLRAHLGSAPYQSTRPDQPGRGHYIFAQPPGRTIGNSTGRLGGDWGQIRGLNGVVIACPSHHGEGGEYRLERTGPVPVLPEQIAELLDDGSPACDAATDAQIRAFLKTHRQAAHPDLVKGPVVQLETRIAAGESRHDAAASVTVWAMEEAAAGVYAADDARAGIKDVFIGALGRQRKPDDRVVTGSQAQSEWKGILAWAVGQAGSKTPAQLRAIRAKAERVGENRIPHVTRTTRQRAEALARAHTVFQKWLGEDYDLGALDVMLSAAAVEALDGDPLWLLLISGSGNAKTETVQALNGVAAHVVSTITSEGALLSASSRRDRSADSTGGLLRVIGERGILAIKDVTTILSMDRNIRGQVLAALREIYDGYWSRNVGTDGGKTLAWRGRIVIIGAVTTAWDTARDVIATMGDRFVLCRIDSTTHRVPSGRKAIGNTGSETIMRGELAAAVADVLAGAADTATPLTDNERDTLLAAADLVTLARTGVEFDYRGDVVDAHAPEMPTRFAKQLAQVVRGAAAVGITKDDAMRLAIRCARDSVPPMRLVIIDYLAENPGSTTGKVRIGIDKPRSTVDRQLQALHMLGVAEVDECDDISEKSDRRTKWYYSLRGDISPKSLVCPKRYLQNCD